MTVIKERNEFLELFQCLRLVAEVIPLESFKDINYLQSVTVFVTLIDCTSI